MNDSVNTDTLNRSVSAQILTQKLTDSNTGERDIRTENARTATEKPDSIIIASKNIRKEKQSDSARIVDSKIHNLQVSLNKISELVSRIKSDSAKLQSLRDDDEQKKNLSLQIDTYNHAIEAILNESKQNDLKELKKIQEAISSESASASSDNAEGGIDKAFAGIESKFSETLKTVSGSQLTSPEKKYEEVAGSVKNLKSQLNAYRSNIDSGDKLGQIMTQNGIGSYDYIKTSIGAEIQVSDTKINILNNRPAAEMAHAKVKPSSYLKLINAG